MSTETRATPTPTVESDWLKIGVVSGALFGVVFGLILWGTGAMPVFGSFIGMPTVLGGWIFHLVLSFVVVIGFAAVLATARLSEYAERLPMLIAIGLAYGVVIWVVIDGFVLSYLAVSVGMAGAIFPGFALETLVEDLVIGFFIALFYYGTRRWIVTGRPVER